MSDFDLQAVERPIQRVPFETWDVDVQMRPMAAGDWVGMVKEYGDAIDAGDSVNVFADLLTKTVVWPELTMEQWLQCSWETLQTLGSAALRVNGLDTDEKKSG